MNKILKTTQYVYDPLHKENKNTKIMMPSIEEPDSKNVMRSVHSPVSDLDTANNCTSYIKKPFDESCLILRPVHRTDQTNDQKIYVELKSRIIRALGLSADLVPADIRISTMTLEARLDVQFYPDNILRYFNNNKHCRVVTSKYDPFLNQVTISVIVSGKGKDNPVSVKIFKCSKCALHFTGCLTIDDMIEAVHILCTYLKIDTAIIGEDGRMKDIVFADNMDNLSFEKIHSFKIHMINCNLIVPFMIDRAKLQNILTEDGYSATYDSNNHAGVKLKYKNTEKKITIFIFESGSIIIILGSQGYEKINEVYVFIYTYLLKNYTRILKTDSITRACIDRYIEKHQETSINHSSDSN